MDRYRATYVTNPDQNREESGRESLGKSLDNITYIYIYYMY